MTSKSYRKFIGELPNRKRKGKYNNTPVEYKKMHFKSKLECEFYQNLEQAVEWGILKFFLWQVPIHLFNFRRDKQGDLVEEYNDKYVIDAVGFYPDDRVEFLEVKGFCTDIYLDKKYRTESQYPHIKIIEVYREDMPYFKAA